MSVIDIRETDSVLVSRILFAEREDDKGSNQANCISRHGPDFDDRIRITEGDHHDYVRVNSEDHARNLIKALEKAIELGWLR